MVSCRTMSCHVMSCHVTQCHVTSCHDTWHRVVSCPIMSWRVMSSHTMSCHIQPHPVTSNHICHLEAILSSPQQPRVGHNSVISKRPRTKCRESSIISTWAAAGVRQTLIKSENKIWRGVSGGGNQLRAQNNQQTSHARQRSTSVRAQHIVVRDASLMCAPPHC